jgi:hypothetical protein
MKKFNWSILIIIFFVSCLSNENEWKKIQKFIVYEKINIEDINIKNETFKEIDVNEIVLLLKSSNRFEKTFLWKGYKLAKITFKNGEEKILKISTYGGMYYDMKSKKLYQIPRESINKWHSLIN